METALATEVATTEKKSAKADWGLVAGDRRFGLDSSGGFNRRPKAQQPHIYSVNTRIEDNAKRFIRPSLNPLRKGFGERRSLPNGGLGASPQKSFNSAKIANSTKASKPNSTETQS